MKNDETIKVTSCFRINADILEALKVKLAGRPVSHWIEEKAKQEVGNDNVIYLKHQKLQRELADNLKEMKKVEMGKAVIGDEDDTN